MRCLLAPEGQRHMPFAVWTLDEEVALVSTLEAALDD
jgi:hypothetical protein